MSAAQLKPKQNQSLCSTDLGSSDAVCAYLHHIGQIPLLNHAEEIIYGQQVQRMMLLLRAKDQLSQERRRAVHQLEWAEAVGVSEAELKQILQQGKLAKTKMIEANLRLVVGIAQKYQSRHLEFLELIQEGNIGLERGVEKFDPTKGYKFSTYAYWWIRQGITRAIAQKSRTIRLPINVNDKLNRIKKTQRELSQKLGRSPTNTEVADELGIESTRVREYLQAARAPLSLNQRSGDNQALELAELIVDREASPEDYTTQELMRQEVRNLLQELTAKEREILSLRFGLEDGQELSLAEIGQKLDLGRERVRQCLRRAIFRLRCRQALSLRSYLSG